MNNISVRQDELLQTIADLGRTWTTLESATRIVILMDDFRVGEMKILRRLVRSMDTIEDTQKELTKLLAKNEAK